MASPPLALTRRSLAGILAVLAPVAATAPAAAAPVVSPALAELIAAHRSANLSLTQALADLDRAEMTDDPGTPLLQRLSDEASDAEVAALDRIHRHTPASHAEFLIVLAYFAEVAADLDPQGFGSWLTTGLHAMAGRMASC